MERKELRVAHLGGGKEVAIWRVVAAPMATRALEGWQGSLSKAIVAGVLCSLSAAGCDPSAHLAHTALHCLATLQQQQFDHSPPSPQYPTEWAHLLVTAITDGLQTLDSYDDDTYREAGMVVGQELIKAVTSEAGEVLVAASAALHAWQKMGGNSALVKQARNCGQALLAASLAQHWSNNASGPTGLSFPEGARKSSDRVANAIVYGNRAAAAAKTSLEQEARPSAFTMSRPRVMLWCRGCMRCAGLATLMDKVLSLNGDYSGTALQTFEPVLVTVVEPVLLRGLAEVLCSDEAAHALQGEVRVMLEKVIRNLVNSRCVEVLDKTMAGKPASGAQQSEATGTEAMEVLRQACTGQLNGQQLLDRILPTGEVAQDIADAAAPFLAAVIVSKLQQVCEVQDPAQLKSFAEAVVTTMVRKPASGAQQSEATGMEAMEVLRQACTGQLDGQQLLERILPTGEVAQDIAEAAAPVIAAVIVSKLQQVCEVQDPEVLRPFARVVVRTMAGKPASGAQQSEATGTEVMEVLRQACTGQLDGQQLLDRILPTGKVAQDIAEAAAPLVAAVIVSKLQQVCEVQDPEVLRPFARVVVRTMAGKPASGAQQSEATGTEVMEVLRQACTGQLDGQQLLDRILPTGEVAQDIAEAAAPLVAAVIVSKLQQVCEVQDPEVLRPFARVVVRTMAGKPASGAQQSEATGTEVMEVLRQACTGQLDGQQLLDRILPTGEVAQDIAEAAAPLVAAVIMSKLQQVCEVQDPEVLKPFARVVVRTMMRKPASGAQQSEATGTEVMEVLRQACTGQLDGEHLERILPPVDVSQDILQAAAQFFAAVIVSKLQQVCEVQDPEVLRPFARVVVRTMAGKPASGAQQSEATGTEVMEVLRQACTGQLDKQQLLDRILPTGEVAQDILLTGVAPLLAVVIMSKLQQVCEVQDPGLLKSFAEAVVTTMVRKPASGAQQSEATGTEAMEVLRQACTGQLNGQQLLERILPTGEVAQDIAEAAAPFLAAVIVSKLQEEVCEVQEPKLLTTLAEGVVKVVDMEILHKACAGELDGKQLLRSILPEKPSKNIIEAATPLLAAVIMSKLQEEGCEVQEPRAFADAMAKAVDVEVLHEACVGELDWKDLLEKTLLPENASEDASEDLVKAAAPIIAAVFVPKLKQLCEVEDPAVVRPIAEVLMKEVDMRKLVRICVGKADWKELLGSILSPGGVSHSLLASAYHLIASKISSKLQGHGNYQVAEGAPRLFDELMGVEKDAAQAVENLLRALLSSGAAPQDSVAAREVMMVVLLASPQLCRVLIDGKAVSRLLCILMHSKDVASKIMRVYLDGGSVAEVLETVAELLEDTSALKQLRDFIKGCLVARGMPKRTAAELVSEEKLPSEALRSFVTLGIDAPIFSPTLHSLEERVADSLQDLEGTIDKLGRDVNPSALVELAKEQVQGSWGSQLLHKIYFYFMYRILPLVDLGTDGLVAASLWDAGGQQRRVWFWIAVTFMVLPYAVLAASVTIYWKSFWNLANPRIRRMDFYKVKFEHSAPFHERLAFNLRRLLRILWQTPSQQLKDIFFPRKNLDDYSEYKEAHPKEYQTLSVILLILQPVLVGLSITVAMAFWLGMSLYFVILIPALVLLDVLLATVSPDRSLEGPFWESYAQLKNIVEGCLESFPQSVLQVILASTGHVPMDSTLFLSLFISLLQTCRHINYLRKQAKLGRTGYLCILRQLLLLDDPDHVPYSTVLQIRPQIDYCQVRAPLESKDLKELSQALIGNTKLRRLVFKCGQINGDGMRFLLRGLARNKVMRELEFHKVREADTCAEFHVRQKETQESEASVDQKLEGINMLLEMLPSLQAVHTLRLDNLQHDLLDGFLSAASGHGKLRDIFLQETSLQETPDSHGVQEAGALELKSMQRFVQQTGGLKSLELCGFNLHRRSLGHLALHKGISSLKLARCRVDFEVCHTWSYSSNRLSSVILLDVELSDPKHIQRLVDRPATCDIFVVITRSGKELFHQLVVKLANNLGKPSKPGEVDAKQPRLVLVGHRPANCTQEGGPRAANMFWQQLKRTYLAVERGLAFIGSVLSVLLSSQLLLFFSTDALYANSRSLTTDDPSLAAIDVLREYLKEPIQWDLVALSGWPQQVSHTIALAVCKQLKQSKPVPMPDEADATGEDVEAFKSGHEGHSAIARTAARKWRSHTTLVLNDNSHGDHLSTVISDVMAAKKGARCIQNLYLRSNAFTTTFFTQIAQQMIEWEADETLLDLIDNDLEAAALFKLVKQHGKIKHGSTNIRLTEHCVLTVRNPTKNPEQNATSRAWKAWPAFLEARVKKHWQKEPSKVKIAFKWDDDQEYVYSDSDTPEQADEGADSALRAVQSPEEDVTLQSWHSTSKRPAWFEAYVMQHLYHKRSVNRMNLQQDNLAKFLEDWGAKAWPEGLLHLCASNKEFVSALEGRYNEGLLLRDDDAKILAKALKMNDCKMKVLRLEGNKIGDKGAKALAVALTPNEKGVFNVSLNTLDLTKNTIGDEGAKALAVALTPNAEGVFNTSLNTLNLQKNEIGPEGAKALAIALTPNADGVFNTSLNTLDLCRNQIGPEGAKALAVALTPNAEGVFNTSLNTLLLAVNNIGNEGASALAVALAPNEAGVFNTSLNTLDVLGNAELEGARALVAAVKQRSAPIKLCGSLLDVEELNLSSESLMDEAAIGFQIRGMVFSFTFSFEDALLLANDLVFNTSLNTVNLAGNIGDEGAKALGVALTPNEAGVFNTSLNTLNLYYNEIGPEGVKALAVALTPNAEGVFNTSLNTLNLHANLIGDEGAKALAIALTPNAEGVFNTSLKTLHLRGNRIGDEGKKALREAGRYRPSDNPCEVQF
ncbi:hypothetical protein CYMTET_7715 [Cymbomonas tetramitiformis]|uniref:Uncharacterized protein n=1 Tax=Cymbomonas tetramitiformis TaxID=36881 RepID=A0AAE0GUZ3_9CHLO|nr:hypothetical protein CYMTET_7715 [Cymbomonas tetramitiformis]